MGKKLPKNMILHEEKETDFPRFKSEKERIRKMSNQFNGMSIAKAFSLYYKQPLPNEVKSSKEINTVMNLELGEIYAGKVKEFTSRYISFDVPGVKDEIISKENLWGSYDNVQNFLMNNDGKLLFEVREKENGRFIVSILNAYYRRWLERIQENANGDQGIMVHIDELLNGGYMCHTDIAPLTQLTGHTYTSAVFIPGSHIVLNIERDFERWIGQDVMIIPQKFVDFRVNKRLGTVEKSLVGSRKRVLQIVGMNNLRDMYNLHKLGEADGVAFEKPAYDGVVTGIINSNKKTGVFVELEDKCITGLLPLDAMDLLNYKPGDPIRVRIAEFEVQEGKEPFEVGKHNNKVYRSNTRPVFEIA